jgi:hypothetical protein
MECLVQGSVPHAHGGLFGMEAHDEIPQRFSAGDGQTTFEGIDLKSVSIPGLVVPILRERYKDRRCLVSVESNKI